MGYRAALAAISAALVLQGCATTTVEPRAGIQGAGAPLTGSVDVEREDAALPEVPDQMGPTVEVQAADDPQPQPTWSWQTVRPIVLVVGAMLVVHLIGNHNDWGVRPD